MKGLVEQVYEVSIKGIDHLWNSYWSLGLIGSFCYNASGWRGQSRTCSSGCQASGEDKQWLHPGRRVWDVTGLLCCWRWKLCHEQSLGSLARSSRIPYRCCRCWHASMPHCWVLTVNPSWWSRMTLQRSTQRHVPASPVAELAGDCQDHSGRRRHRRLTPTTNRRTTILVAPAMQCICQLARLKFTIFQASSSSHTSLSLILIGILFALFLLSQPVQMLCSSFLLILVLLGFLAHVCPGYVVCYIWIPYESSIHHECFTEN